VFRYDVSAGEQRDRSQLLSLSESKPVSATELWTAAIEECEGRVKQAQRGVCTSGLTLAVAHPNAGAGEAVWGSSLRSADEELFTEAGL
jgi:hypothetical protein